MDDVERGYYLELEGHPDMLRKNSRNNEPSLRGGSEKATNEANGGADHTSEDAQNELERLDSEEFLDSVNEMYGLDKGKTKLYREFFNMYSEHPESDQLNEVESSEPGRLRGKILLWLMILVLLSNPILGGYNLYHFTNYKENFAALQPFSLAADGTGALADTELTNADANKPTNRFFNFKFFKKDNSKEANKEQEDLEREMKAKNEELLRVSTVIGKKVTRYCFFEIFGELIFGLFSLLLVSLCRLPCNNNSNSVRFMLPSLFMFYMVIYRFLALYVLLTSLKIFTYALFVCRPEWALKVPSLLLFPFTYKKLDLRTSLPFLRKIYELDSFNVHILLLFAVENVYITFSETMELFSFFLKILFSFIRKKVLKKSELNFYSSNDYGGFKFLRRCFSRDTFSSSDPHEKYIHSLYNYASDIGTYLKNIEISDYTKGLDDITNKFKNSAAASNY